MNRRRIFYLDFIRVVSVLLIFIYHFHVALENFEIDIPIPLITNTANTTLGHLGVSLFLLLSGSSLAYTYPKYSSLKQFYKKRFLNIFPAFWLVYIGLFLWFDVPEQSGIFSSQTPLWHLLFSVIGMDGYLSPIFPTFYKIGEWFLGLIILSYIIFPFLYWCIKKIPKLFFFFTIAWYFGWTHYLNGEYFPLECNFLVRIVDIVIGIYFITYVKQLSQFVGYLSILGCVTALTCPLPISLIDRIELSSIFVFTALCSVSTLIPSRWIQKLCSWISQCSYPFFLVHHIVLSRALHIYANKSFSIAQYFVIITLTFLYTLFIASGIERMLRVFFHSVKKKNTSSQSISKKRAYTK